MNHLCALQQWVTAYRVTWQVQVDVEGYLKDKKAVRVRKSNSKNRLVIFSLLWMCHHIIIVVVISNSCSTHAFNFIYVLKKSQIKFFNSFPTDINIYVLFTTDLTITY